ncbi:MAG: hypothetical protein F6K29_13430 [Okeania sp. SIO2G5]|nr:hypothetical protein [Okeania sp. SIO2G5]
MALFPAVVKLSTVIILRDSPVSFAKTSIVMGVFAVVEAVSFSAMGTTWLGVTVMVTVALELGVLLLPSEIS